MDVLNIDSLYAVITGKAAGSAAYSSTKVQYLDHYKSNGLNVENLGDLVAANKDSLSASSFYPSDAGTLVGINFESVEYETNALSTNRFSSLILTVDGKAYKNALSESFDNSRYVLIGLNATASISRAKEVRVTGISSGFLLDVYLVVNEKSLSCMNYRLSLALLTQKFTKIGSKQMANALKSMALRWCLCTAKRKCF